MRRAGLVRAALVIATVLMIGAGSPDAFERSIAALVTGQAGESRGDRAAMLAAARILDASGAAPVDMHDDAVGHWLRLANGRLGDASRNRALGPGYRLLMLPASGGATFEQTFYAGQRARVAVAPAPTASFALSVTENGSAEPVCAATPPQMLCDWVPVYTARFRIALVNQGAQAQRFYLVVE